ncbi:calpain 7 [Dissophora globulifera]|uniref:Calpain 7 n=1 Tax=Dissophora globulifera TaxID=979702 RepID=A0A9P6R9X5_9FUNG|nr:calpain 7 [Dissophora globulifera]
MDSYPFPGSGPGSGLSTPTTPNYDPELSPSDSRSETASQMSGIGGKEELVSVQDLYTEAYPLALQAVQEDRNGDHHTARLLYFEVCEIFTKILKLLPPGQEQELVVRKSHQYTKRAEAIYESRSPSTAPVKSIKALPEYERFSQEAQATAPDGPIKDELKQKLSNVMSKAEDLKGVPVNSIPLQKNKAGAAPVISGPSNLTLQEVQVIKSTMVMNEISYYPWSDSDVKDLLREKGRFTDPDGMLKLSENQMAKFGSWKRVSEIMENPKMICLVSSRSIVQDFVTDCSFVASLCVSASYERRWKKRLIRACIYPKNKYDEPCYNPQGKYLVKLMFNGIARRVVVDDYLPVSKTGSLMCTFSTNKNEIWPSIIEKAYMKLMGGYDFPGSNSGIDLYALTEWIPEHLFIKDMDKEEQWRRMMNGQRKGVALVTIATGEMNDEEADRLGLVPTHAYAVLDLKEVHGLRLMQVKNPWSHMRWKGPFSHLDADHWTEELKKELNFDQFAALKNDDGIFWIDYDSVCSTFNTIHINWNLETLKHRAVIHAPWPCNYSPRKDMKDNYNLGYNPQFTLTTHVRGQRSCEMWLLLSKHTTRTEENRDFITLLVFDVKKQPQNQAAAAAAAAAAFTPPTPGSATTPSTTTLVTSSNSSSSMTRRGGTRVFYEGNSMIKGLYVNSLHILVRFQVPPGQNEYSIVPSQRDKTRDSYFTLRAYAACEFELREMPTKYAVEKKIAGRWTEETAGGSSYNAGFLNNPQYKLVVPVLPAPQTTTSVLFMLESEEDFATHVQLVNSQGKRVSCVWTKDIVVQSGEYRHGFCYCEANDLRPGQYTVVVSTFHPGQIGKFKLTMQSHLELSLTPIPVEGAGMFKKILKGEWVLGVSAMGWHHHQSLSYARNPHFLVPITEMTTFMVRLQTPEMDPMPKTNVTIFERLDEGVLGKEVCSSGPYTSVSQGVATEATTLLPNQYGYLVVVSTYEPELAGKFVLYAYSDRALDIEAGGGARTTVNVNMNRGTASSVRSLSLSLSSAGGGGGGSPLTLSGPNSPLSPPSSAGYANQRPSARFRRQFGSGSGQGGANNGSGGSMSPSNSGHSG